jgi:tetratricopeptide (TPR) repeat protein
VLHFPGCILALRRACRSAVALVAACLAVEAGGHPEIEAALARLNAQIAAAPADASLFLERGELYARHHDWVSAEANYLLAAELAPSLPRLDRARGALALATRALHEARGHFDRALDLDPRDAEALILRSRTRAAFDDRAGALADLEASLALLPNPRPELFLERAALLPTSAAAVRSLDAAMIRIGPAHTLQLRALEIEESTGDFDAALARLERVVAHSERRETWLKRRGDLLMRAGRIAEARQAYTNALAAIAALPEWLRESPATARLLAELTRLAPASS